MSSTPHPTIAGVTVEFETRENPFVPLGESPRPYEVRVLRAVGTPHRVESWTWPTDYNPGPFIRVDEVFTFERAETVIAMIRDQADWLAAQGATT